MDNKQRHVNSGITFNQFCIGCLIYLMIGVLSYFSAVGYKMKSYAEWYSDKIAHYQQVEIVHTKLGELKEAEIAKETIEHYQELLKQQ